MPEPWEEKAPAKQLNGKNVGSLKKHLDAGTVGGSSWWGIRSRLWNLGVTKMGWTGEGGTCGRGKDMTQETAREKTKKREFGEGCEKDLICFHKRHKGSRIALPANQKTGEGRTPLGRNGKWWWEAGTLFRKSEKQVWKKMGKGVVKQSVRLVEMGKGRLCFPTDKSGKPKGGGEVETVREISCTQRHLGGENFEPGGRCTKGCVGL